MSVGREKGYLTRLGACLDVLRTHTTYTCTPSAIFRREVEFCCILQNCHRSPKHSFFRDFSQPTQTFHLDMHSTIKLIFTRARSSDAEKLVTLGFGFTPSFSISITMGTATAVNTIVSRHSTFLLISPVGAFRPGIFIIQRKENGWVRATLTLLP